MKLTPPSTTIPHHPVTAEMLVHLPEIVQKYLRYSGVVGQPWIEIARLEQAGRFRRAADGPWMPVSARQTFTTNPVGFVWEAKFKVAGLPLVRARDSYENGRGRIYGKVGGLVPLFDDHGPEINQGTLIRYLSEMIWFPTAFLGENISWQEVGPHSAQVTLTDYGENVSGVLHFDEDGRPQNFTTRRYRGSAGQYTLESWSIPMSDYASHGGFYLPVRGQVVWNLVQGNLPYFEWEIRSLEYNLPV